jgi:glutathione-regulated potassium-efflux system ancillary protein KefG
MAKRVDPDELVDSDQVATMLGLGSRNAVRVYLGRYPDFPQPIVQRGRCLLWLRPDIERWQTSRQQS